MVLWIVACICFSFSLLQLTNCQEVIKDASLKKFWYKNAYVVNDEFGTVFQYDEEGGYRTCAAGNELETWLLTNTLTSNQTLPDVKLYIEIESQVEECYVEGGVCFKDGFELFKYNGAGEPKIPHDPKDASNKKKKQEARAFFHGNFTFLGNITGNKTSKERVNTTFSLNFRKFHDITFAIKSSGGCGRVIRIKVYYYFFKERSIKSVMFKRTMSPQSGSKLVLGNCSVNSRRVLHMGDLRAYCHSNGSWIPERNTSCLCDGGYESTDELGCSPCKSGQYKKEVSNEKCIPCPENTVDNRITCICINGYYNHPDDLNFKTPSKCYAPINLDEEPKIEQAGSNSANVTWLPPLNNSGVDETIFYDIFCYICIQSNCNKSCDGLTYTPKQYNLTGTRAIVSGLVYDQTYEFRIYPKNSLNKVIPRNKWNFTASKPFTFESKEFKDGANSKSKTSEIIAIAGGVASFLLIIVVVVLLLRRRQSASQKFQSRKNDCNAKNNKRNSFLDLEALHDGNIELQYVDVLEDWEISPDDLKVLDKNLGAGQFGVVRQGLYTPKNGDPEDVAIKMLKENASESELSDLLAEIKILKEANKEQHPNIIKFIGSCFMKGKLLMVTEFCPGGNLRKFLIKSRVSDNSSDSHQIYVNITSTLSDRQLLRMAVDIACGMVHLSSQKFLHRDLAARNILLGNGNVAKICDFGLARDVGSADEYMRNTQNLLPVRWMSVESLFNGIFTTASDVWSFGVLLYEITTLGEEPYKGIPSRAVITHVESGGRMSKPPHCSNEVYEIMSNCWKVNPKERPTFPEILQALLDMLDDNEHTYINVTQVEDGQQKAVQPADRAITIQ